MGMTLFLLFLLFLSGECSTWAPPVSTTRNAQKERVVDVLVVPVSTCGVAPKAAPWELQDAAFGNGTNSVRNMFSYCTRGRITLSGMVLPTTLDVPCIPARGASCDFMSWSSMIDQYLDVNGYARFKHRVYVVPDFCPFAGMGEIGCFGRQAGSCKAWVNSLYATGPAPYLHELGHNFGLQHAGTPSEEYGDSTDAMGSCCEPRCFSGVRTHQLRVDAPTVEMTCSEPVDVSLEHKQYALIRCPSVWTYLQYYNTRDDEFKKREPWANEYADGVLVVYQTKPWNQTFFNTVLIDRWGSSGVYDLPVEQNNPIRMRLEISPDATSASVSFPTDV